jgi:hypothetical protein
LRSGMRVTLLTTHRLGRFLERQDRVAIQTGRDANE